MGKRKYSTGKKIVVIVGCVLIFFLVLVFILSAFSKGIIQPISFNHKIHAENDMECSDCHLYFKKQASSGRPSLETCTGCHEEPLGESTAEKKLMEYIKTMEEIEWQRLYRVPEDVYFSHRRHVVLGEIECSTCHGDIGNSSRPPAKPVEISMKKCMKCHKARGVNNDCIACHR